MNAFRTQWADCAIMRLCFNVQTGDFRTNENLGLAAIQTIFVRFHNFVANKLPIAWPSRIRLEEARRICVAMYQHIVYNEYLPLLIGKKGFE